MDVDGACPLIRAAQGVVHTGGSNQRALGGLGAKLSLAMVTSVPSAMPCSSWNGPAGRIEEKPLEALADRAQCAIASVALIFSERPSPMAAMRSIQASTPGVASRMGAITLVRVRVNHSGW